MSERVTRYTFRDETEHSSAFLRADVETFAQDGDAFVTASDYDALSRDLAATRASLDEALGLLWESCMKGPSIEWAERRDALLRKVGP